MLPANLSTRTSDATSFSMSSFVEILQMKKSCKEFHWTFHKMEFRIFFQTVTFCRSVCLERFANDRSIPLLRSTTFRKDPTETEEQKYLLLLCGLRFRQFLWFLMDMGLMCRDSIKMSSQARMKTNRFFCMNNIWFSIWVHEMLQTVHRFLPQFQLPLGNFRSNKYVVRRIFFIFGDDVHGRSPLASKRFLHGVRVVSENLQASQFGTLYQQCACQLACLRLDSLTFLR